MMRVTKIVTVMYDTVYFRLTQNEVSNVDFLAEIPVYLDNVGEHSYNGQNVVTGDLNGLKITLNRWQMKIKDGSLCKWYLGNNFQTMGKRDAKDAISALSDTLHLPIDKALITRLDVAQNLIMRYPADVYFSHLGVLRYATRLQEPGGIYYNRAGGRLCFYDKNKEQKSHKEPIPDLYIGRNVLRYEQRYIGRLAAQFKAKEVTGAMLYNEGFYMAVINRWRDDYLSIQKINDISLNFNSMKTKQQFYKMGILALVERAGGQLGMIGQINDAQKRGELTKKQAFDLRRAVNDACTIQEDLTAPSDAIGELDKKIKEAARYYR